MFDMSTSEGGTPTTCRTLTIVGIPKWKWDSVFIDFVVGLPPTQRKNT